MGRYDYVWGTATAHMYGKMPAEKKDIHKEIARALLEFGWSCLYR